MEVETLMGPALPGSSYEGVVNYHGILVGIEHAAGDENPWSGRKTKAAYGEIPGTMNIDGDPVDVLLGDNWDSEKVFVLQQRVPAGQNEHDRSDTEANGGGPQYDEDKVVLGAGTEMEARDLFQDYYRGAGREVGGVLIFGVDEFRDRLSSHGGDGLPISKADGGGAPDGFVEFGSKKGGKRKRRGSGYEYWYPSKGEAHRGRRTYRELIPDYKLDIVAGTDGALSEDDIRRAADIAKKVHAGISESADICKMQPPVCAGNMGIPRSNMPQIMEESISSLLSSTDPEDRKKGAAAVAVGGDPESTESIFDQFVAKLKAGGATFEQTEIPVGQLKATQREIQAGKTYGMADAYLKGKFRPQDAEILVSSDGHILDGHHRYSALLTADPTVKMKALRVSITMKEFLDESFKQPGVFRADLHGDIVDPGEPLNLTGKPDAADAAPPPNTKATIAKAHRSNPYDWHGIPKGRKGGQRKKKRHGNGYDYRYGVAAGDGPAKIKPGHEVALTKAALDALLQGGNYSIISAGRNPAHADEAKLAEDDPVFAARHERLKADIVAHGFNFTEAVGHYGGKEHSLVVYHAEPSDEAAKSGLSVIVHHETGGQSEYAYIRGLGRKYNQDSVIHSEAGHHEMHYTVGDKVGRFHPGGGFKYVPLADDFFTVAKLASGDASKFSLVFDWDTMGSMADALLKAARKRKAKAKVNVYDWHGIPKGRKGGERRKKRRGTGYDYRYHKQPEEADHPAWEIDYGAGSGTKGLSPGALVAVPGNHELWRWTPDHDEEAGGEHLTWVTSLTTGEHRPVDASKLLPMRGHDPKAAARAAAAARAQKRAKAQKDALAAAKKRKPRGKAKPAEKRALRPLGGPRKHTPIVAGPNSPRVPVLAGSTATKGSIEWKIENGQYPLMEYREGRSSKLGMFIPREDQTAFLHEMNGIVHSAALKVAKIHGIRSRQDGEPTPEYQELSQNAKLGLVLAQRSYRGGEPFKVRAYSYALAYAQQASRAELGKGVPLSSMKMRLVDGFIAARAQASASGDNPTAQDIARLWQVRKGQVFQGDLGRYATEGDSVQSQGSQAVPMGRWRVKGPDGIPRGHEYPGKIDMAEELMGFLAGDRASSTDYAEEFGQSALSTTERASTTGILPRHTATGMGIGEALTMKEDVNWVLSALPASDRTALVLHWGLDGGDPMKMSEVARAMGLTPHVPKKKTKKTKSNPEEQYRYLGKKLIKVAHDRFKAEAAKQGLDHAAAISRDWSVNDSDAPVVTPIGGPTQNDLLIRFGGDNQRLRMYQAALASGMGQEVGELLDADTAARRRSKAHRGKMKALTEWHADYSYKKRVEAFRQQTATWTPHESEVRDLSTGSDLGVEHFADEILQSYHRAIAAHGPPQPAQAGNAPAGRSKVWTQQRLDGFLGRRPSEQRGDNED